MGLLIHPILAGRTTKSAISSEETTRSQSVVEPQIASSGTTDKGPEEEEAQKNATHHDSEGINCLHHVKPLSQNGYGTNLTTMKLTYSL